MEAAELTDGYRKLHSLKAIRRAGKGKGYVSECVCGWQSPVARFLVARSSLTDHVLEEADKLLEEGKQ